MANVTRVPATVAAGIGALCLLAAPANANAVAGLIALALAVAAFTTAGALWQLC
ncbi:hypothetical protein [Halobacterium zhouii]|uniref:hypothetical protein n=1 Tax=Halobacterium zhouii TaxID=2902624 RepID=UPI001E5B0751|nr:hypothetical protein [Halobacterium zhouii]